MLIPAFVDAHLHLRQDEELHLTVPQSDRYCEYALVMPNTKPPILTGFDVESYRKKILNHAKQLKPLMTIKLTAKTDPQEIWKSDISAVKLYPDGVTTNSEDGIGSSTLLDMEKDRNFYECLDAISKKGISLSIHGEMPGQFCLYREIVFLPVVEKMISLFPKLRIVLEHITEENTVNFVKSQYKNCAATITLHHLLITLDDVIGDKINPHLFCKPIAKYPHDKQALAKIVIQGRSNFFLGSDSAPHNIGFKECASGCAGVFSSPVLPEALMSFFVSNNATDKMANFVSGYAREWYKLPKPSWMLEITEGETKIPERYNASVYSPGYKSFLAGTTLPYKVSQVAI